MVQLELIQAIDNIIFYPNASRHDDQAILEYAEVGGREGGRKKVRYEEGGREGEREGGREGGRERATCLPPPSTPTMSREPDS